MSFGIFALLLVICTVIHAYDEDRDEPYAGDEDRDEPYAGDEDQDDPSAEYEDREGRVGVKKTKGKIGVRQTPKPFDFNQYELHFAVRKYKSLFNLFDVNKNGVLDASDFQEAGRRFGKIASLDREGIATVRKLIPKTWSTMNFDEGRKGKPVTKTQFVELLLLSLRDKKSHTTKGLAFTVIDINKDYLVSSTEYVNFLKAFRVPERIARAAFLILDENDDGHLTRHDFIKLSIDYLQSVDENSRSQYFYGTIKA